MKNINLIKIQRKGTNILTNLKLLNDQCQCSDCRKQVNTKHT